MGVGWGRLRLRTAHRTTSTVTHVQAPHRGRPSLMGSGSRGDGSCSLFLYPSTQPIHVPLVLWRTDTRGHSKHGTYRAVVPEATAAAEGNAAEKVTGRDSAPVAAQLVRHAATSGQRQPGTADDLQEGWGKGAEERWGGGTADSCKEVGAAVARSSPRVRAPSVRTLRRRQAEPQWRWRM